jgi:hypothetical protein
VYMVGKGTMESSVREEHGVKFKGRNLRQNCREKVKVGFEAKDATCRLPFFPHPSHSFEKWEIHITLVDPHLHGKELVGNKERG